MGMKEVPIRQAAKAVHRSRAYVRMLIEAGQVEAIVCGGTARAPRLRVDVEKLMAAIQRTSVYQPKQTAAHNRPASVRRLNGKPMHPAAAAM